MIGKVKNGESGANRHINEEANANEEGNFFGILLLLIFIYYKFNFVISIGLPNFLYK